MNSFDQAAPHYEDFAFIQRELADWLANWIPGDRSGDVLEAGAGTGFFTERILPWPGRVIATDASPAMVAQGKAHAPAADWQVARADRLPDVSAKWIFSASFLQWAEDPSLLLQHWKSRLAPRGRIVAGLFVRPTLTELYQVLPETAPLPWRIPEAWEKHIEAAGLRLIRSSALERRFNFPSAMALLRNLHSIGAAPVRRISGPQLRRALAQYDRHFAEDRGVRSTWTFYRFEASHPSS